MSSATTIRPVSIEPRENLVRAAKHAALRIAERAPEVDRQRRVPVENIKDLHEAGLLTVTIPRDLGGSEADLVSQIAVYEIIGGACASTAWVMGNFKVAVGFAFTGAVVGEFVASSRGLGYLLQFGQSTYNAALTIALILIIMTFVLVLFAVAERLERRLLAWRYL